MRTLNAIRMELLAKNVTFLITLVNVMVMHVTVDSSVMQEHVVCKLLWKKFHNLNIITNQIFILQ